MRLTISHLPGARPTTLAHAVQNLGDTSVSARAQTRNVKAEAEQERGFTLDQLVPRPYPTNASEEAEWDDYRRVVFPLPRSTGKIAQSTRNDFRDMVMYLAKESAYVNSAFYIFRYIVANSSWLSAGAVLSSGADNGDKIDSDLAVRWDAKMALLTDEAVIDATINQMASLSAGGSHIVRPSVRQKNGYDVIFCGLPGSQMSMNVDATYDIPSNKNGYAYRQLFGDGGSGNSDLAKAAIKCAKLLADRLAKAKDTVNLQNGSKRQMYFHPLDSSLRSHVAAAFAEFQKLTGVRMPAIKTENLESLAHMGKYFSMLVIREANSSLVNFKLSNPQQPDEASDIAEEFLALSPQYGVSLALSIPERVALYTAQATGNEKPSITALTTWASVWSAAVMRPPKARGRVKMRMIPRYVIPASKAVEMSQRRKDLGLYQEEGRSDDNNLFIASDGSLGYLPKTSQISIENAKNYEKLMDEALQLSFDAGSPLNSGAMGVTDKVFALASPNYAQSIGELKKQMGRYAGAAQSYSWDYNVILTSSVAEPDKIVATSLVGATPANDLFLATFMREKYYKAMDDMFTTADEQTPEGRQRATIVTYSSEHAGVETCSVFRRIFHLYEYLQLKGIVPNVQDLVKEAAANLNITDLQEGDHAVYERGLYKGLISRNLALADGNTVEQLKTLLSSAVRDASGDQRSNIVRAVYMSNPNPPSDAVVSDPHYFNPQGPFHEFGNVFNYLGGQVFFCAVKHLLKTDPKLYTLVDPNSVLPLVPYKDLTEQVLPMLTLLGKLIPEKEKLFERADEQSEVVKVEENTDTSDIHLPGSKEGFQVFPHQATAINALAKKPKFAILDIQPGGGKTTIILVDIGMLIHSNSIKRPVVFCPGRLAKNWIEDMHKYTGGQWNMIPITTSVYTTWGEKRLTALLEKAPPNTICVVGNEFLSRTKSTQIVLGRHVSRTNPALEFIKRFGFDYVALDESHKAKNMTSNTHNTIKQLTTMSQVKYLRLATGTLINDVLRDIVGQSALYSAYMFRSAEEFDADNKGMALGLGGRTSPVYFATAARKAREQLAKFATVITVKRREWAFMLPIPKESFQFVSLVKEGENGDAHQLMYDAIFRQTLDSIKSNKELMDLLSGRSREDDDDEEGGSDDESEKDAKIAKALGELAEGGIESDQDEDVISELESALTPYLQRLEMAIIDPMNDRDAYGNRFGEAFFNKIDSHYVSRPVEKVIERIRLHYKPMPWERGRAYEAGEFADFGDKRYVLKEGATKSGGKYVSTTPPDVDKDNWQPEAFGKVLVFCRYVRSVEAIYNALPEDLKKVARRFHGEVETRWSDLEEFKSSPVSSPTQITNGKGVQIFIANEQAITEGHNLQMASRIIRVELPWAPGDLDQSSARIFRPDPSGKNARETIYLDWIIANGTLVVAKLGRLISKMLSKAQFDEADNDFSVMYHGSELSYKNLNAANLPPIKMSLKNIEGLRYVEDLRDPERGLDYIAEYQKLVALQSPEFEHIRKTRPARMLDVEPTPMPPEARRMEFVPYIPDLNLPDPNNWGLHRLNLMMQNDSDPKARQFIDDKSKLIGQYVHTDHGNGVIVRVRTVRAAKRGEAEDTKADLSSVTVQLAGTDELISFNPDVVFLATKLNASNVKQFAPKSLWLSGADQKRLEREEARKQRQEEREARENEKNEKRQKRDLEKLEVIVKRKLGAGAGPRPSPTPKETTVSVQLYPVVYNGFLAVEGIADNDDENAVFKKHGFKPYGDYAFVKIDKLTTYNAVLDYVEEKFDLSKATVDRLELLNESFNTGRGRKFAIELTPVSDFKNFYTVSHKPSKARGESGLPELKLYPMIINQTLFLVADIATNPVIKRHLGKSIPGTTAKFTTGTGMFLAFFSSKAALKEKVLSMKKSGLEISNFEEFKEEFNALKVTASKAKETNEAKAKKAPSAPVKKAPAKAAPSKKPVAKAPAKKALVKAPVKAPAKKAVPAKSAPAKRGVSVKPANRRK